MKYNLSIIIILFFVIALGCKSNQANNSSKIINATPKQTPLVIESKTEAPKSESKVSKKDFGNSWAFTVEEGILACHGSRGLGEVTFLSNGKIYALNGTAKSAKKYLPIEEIWAADPKISGVKKDIGIFIEKGLKLCQ